MNHLGIDISKDSFDATLLFGTKEKHHKFENSLLGVECLLEWLRKKIPLSEVHVCMEATGKYWELLAEVLQETGVQVSVENPLKIKSFSRTVFMRSKTDKLDSKLIAQYCRDMHPEIWSPQNPVERAIRDLRRHADALIVSRTKVENRLKTPRQNEIVKASSEAEKAFLEGEIEKLESEILKLIKANCELKIKYELLTSIPGVGPKLAGTYLAEVSIPFANSRELEIYAGIAPSHRESGTSVRFRGRISKVGNSRLRKSLYMPALAAIRCNPIIHDFRMRLKEAGKPGKIIVCAVMRKLLRWMHAVLKSGKPFDLQHVSKRPMQIPQPI